MQEVYKVTRARIKKCQLCGADVFGAIHGMLHFRDKHEVSFEVSKILIRDLYPVLRKGRLYKTTAERCIK